MEYLRLRDVNEIVFTINGKPEAVKMRDWARFHLPILHEGKAKILDLSASAIAMVFKSFRNIRVYHPRKWWFNRILENWNIINPNYMPFSITDDEVQFKLAVEHNGYAKAPSMYTVTVMPTTVDGRRVLSSFNGLQ